MNISFLCNDSKLFLTIYPTLKKIADLPHYDALGNIFLPINDLSLYLRYWISISGTVFDAIDNRYSKYPFDANVEFEDSQGFRQCHQIRNLVMSTFYHLPKEFRTKIVEDSLMIKFPTLSNFHENEETYYLHGVRFDKITEFPGNYYISQQGAVCIIKKNQSTFIPIIPVNNNPGVLIDGKEKVEIIPLIIKYCKGVNLSNCIATHESDWVSSAYSFYALDELNSYLSDFQYVDAFKYKKYVSPLTVNQIDAFVNKSRKHDRHHEKYTYFRRIPISGIYSHYMINAHGEILDVDSDKFIYPSNYSASKDTVTRLYYTLNSYKKGVPDYCFDVGELLLWNDFRLTIDAVDCDYQPLMDYPVTFPITKFIIIKREMEMSDDKSVLMIGEEPFLRCNIKKYRDFYISKHGAVYNITSNTFQRIRTTYETIKNKPTKITPYLDIGTDSVELMKLVISAWLNVPLSYVIANTRDNVTSNQAIYNLYIAGPTGIGIDISTEIPNDCKPTDKRKLTKLIENYRAICSKFNLDMKELRKTCPISSYD